MLFDFILWQQIRLVEVLSAWLRRNKRNWIDLSSWARETETVRLRGGSGATMENRDRSSEINDCSVLCSKRIFEIFEQACMPKFLGVSFGYWIDGNHLAAAWTEIRRTSLIEQIRRWVDNRKIFQYLWIQIWPIYTLRLIANLVRLFVFYECVIIFLLWTADSQCVECRQPDLS